MEIPSVGAAMRLYVYVTLMAVAAAFLVAAVVRQLPGPAPVGLVNPPPLAAICNLELNCLECHWRKGIR